LHVLHPFMPFITEEIWQNIKIRKTGESIMISKMPKPEVFDIGLLTNFNITKEIITQLRNIRKEKNIPFKTQLQLLYKDNTQSRNKSFDSVTTRLSGIQDISEVTEKPDNVSQFVIKKVEYFLPLGNLTDKKAELKKLREELNYTKGFLNSVMKKLSNERFVNNAPVHVVEKEKIKQADAEAKIKALEEQIKNL
ncbi:MAG: class I tRNA ligase family protein, partial [Bacteroidales bacterium]|nr:class I tRNA ligase family protein [Bacteroidales bacterium]